MHPGDCNNMCKGRDQSCSEPVRGIGDCGRKWKRTAAYACSGEPNQEIVLCGSIAAGVLRIFDEKREELSKRFVPAFMGQIQDRIRTGGFPCASQCEAGKYTKRGTTGDCNAADWKRWNLASLWELTEAANVGMQIEMSGFQFGRNVWKSVNIIT